MPPFSVHVSGIWHQGGPPLSGHYGVGGIRSAVIELV